MKKIILMLTLMLSFSVFAIELSDAKQQGLVGEQMDGLLGVIEASPEVKELVNSINTQRLAVYKQIAEKNAMSIDQVSVLAGEKAIKKTPKGQYIQNTVGQWVIK
ncbi:YdbL family protein [Psychromonas sp.]|uniref:YdbL family protein n=1 Tax=Psychromonas sp. TaxID=1884585 RepID=UPI0039E6F2F5